MSTWGNGFTFVEIKWFEPTCRGRFIIIFYLILIIGSQPLACVLNNLLVFLFCGVFKSYSFFLIVNIFSSRKEIS